MSFLRLVPKIASSYTDETDRRRFISADLMLMVI
jgi:hypothetical protein